MPNPIVLIVDDEPSVLYTTELILQSQGYTVIGVGTVPEALQLLKALSFDLLLLDCVPGNAELVATARHLHPNLRIAICSGDPQQSICSQADLVLHKPVPAPELLRQIAQLLPRAAVS
jgi:CheY-like chemotaxis protein